MRWLVTLCVILLCVPAALMSQQAVDSPPTLVAAVSAETRATIDSLFDSLRARDVTALRHLYAVGPTVLHISDGNVYANDTLARGTAAGLAGLKSFSASWEPISVQVLDPHVAVWTIRLKFATVDTAGAEWARRGVWTLVLKRFAEGWRVVRDHRTLLPDS